MSVTKVKTDNITSLDASQLSGTLPVMSGANLTGLSSVTKNASDPAIGTNPSGGVGTLWANTTSGEMFACTDATAGANVWINVGSGTGNVQPYLRPWLGTVSGYQSGGAISGGYTNAILKYSFTSDANGTDVGNLTHNTDGHACHASETHGYAATGDHPVTTTIHKWSFASDGDAVAYSGVVTGGGWGTMGTYSKTNGYTWGRNNSGPFHNTIDKFNFASEANATDVGNMTQPGSYLSGASTSTYGYCAGGSPGTHDNVIDRVSFSTDGNATDVGDMTGNHGYMSGHQSETHGYTTGGAQGSPFVTSNKIQKYQFAASANASNIADILSARGDVSGSSSTTHGYASSGGATVGAPTYSNTIEKFSTSSDANSTDVGDMLLSTAINAGCQH